MAWLRGGITSAVPIERCPLVPLCPRHFRIREPVSSAGDLEAGGAQQPGTSGGGTVNAPARLGQTRLLDEQREALVEAERLLLTDALALLEDACPQVRSGIVATTGPRGQTWKLCMRISACSGSDHAAAESRPEVGVLPALE